MNADRLTRWTAFAAVLAVAAVAAWISYRHAVEIVTAHGEPGAVGRLYPVVIDGLIVAASMVLLDAARHREPAPRLAWWLLGAGIGATLAANVLAGVPSGWLGAIVAAWPAARVRRLLRAADDARAGVGQASRTRRTRDVPDPHSGLNGHREAAAEMFAADLEAGRRARHPRYPLRAARRPGQGQPGTGVPERAHPYPVSPRRRAVSP